jgi:hypothetical protein
MSAALKSTSIAEEEDGVDQIESEHFDDVRMELREFMKLLKSRWTVKTAEKQPCSQNNDRSMSWSP